MKILISGFEPFGENQINSSQKLLETLPKKIINGVECHKLLLPVNQQTASHLLISAIYENRPQAVLCFGLASGRAVISLERLAINLLDFRIPDNAGIRISDQPIIPNGPAAYFSTLPIQVLLIALKEANIPAEISLSAGAFLCNQVFYSMMHELSRHKLPILSGFIHLPTLPEDAATHKKAIPSMSLNTIVRAAKIMIECLSKNSS